MLVCRQYKEYASVGESVDYEASLGKMWRSIHARTGIF